MNGSLSGLIRFPVCTGKIPAPQKPEFPQGSCKPEFPQAPEQPDAPENNGAPGAGDGVQDPGAADPAISQVLALVNDQRANLLNPGYSRIGIGHVKDSRGVDHWVQLFLN